MGEDGSCKEIVMGEVTTQLRDKLLRSVPSFFLTKMLFERRERWRHLISMEHSMSYHGMKRFFCAIAKVHFAWEFKVNALTLMCIETSSR